MISNLLYEKEGVVKGLINVCQKFNLTTSTIITSDTEAQINQNNIIITVIPFHKC